MSNWLLNYLGAAWLFACCLFAFLGGTLCVYLSTKVIDAIRNRRK